VQSFGILLFIGIMSKPKGKSGHAQKVDERRTGRRLTSKPATSGLSDAGWSILIATSFLILGLVGITRHEMWRDEYQAWMIARDSSSLTDLIRISRFDGHPATWFAVLFFLSRLTSNNPFWMQVVHLLIATATVYLFNRYCPLKRFYRLLFSFGYFPLYEYGLISREYALGVLCVAAICVLYRRRWQHCLQISILLLLLANISVYGLVLAITFAALLGLDYLVSIRDGRTDAISKTKFALSCLIFVCGPLLIWFQLKPGEEHYFPLDWATGFDFKRLNLVLTFLLRSYFPLPDLNITNFWNSHFLLSGLGDSMPTLSLVILLVAAALFLRKPLILFCYLAGTLGILALSYLAFLPWLRHIGHLYILFIACIWLAHYYDPVEISSQPLKSIAGIAGDRFAHVCLTVILGVNFVAGIYAFQKDLVLPFSNSRAAAQYIKNNNLDQLPIVGSTDYIVSPLAGLLSRQIFYPERGEEGTYILWDKKRKNISEMQEIASCLPKAIQQGHGKAVLVLDQALKIIENNEEIPVKESTLAPDIRITFQAQFASECIVGDETYYIYIAQKQIGR
jgi:hypothetical protein